MQTLEKQKEKFFDVNENINKVRSQFGLAPKTYTSNLSFKRYGNIAEDIERVYILHLGFEGLFNELDLMYGDGNIVLDIKRKR